MCYVVRESDELILYRIDAWAMDSYGKALKWAKVNGHEVLRDEITLLGDMIIWVK